MIQRQTEIDKNQQEIFKKINTLSSKTILLLNIFKNNKKLEIEKISQDVLSYILSFLAICDHPKLKLVSKFFNSLYYQQVFSNQKLFISHYKIPTIKKSTFLSIDKKVKNRGFEFLIFEDFLLKVGKQSVKFLSQIDIITEKKMIENKINQLENLCKWIKII